MRRSLKHNAGEIMRSCSAAAGDDEGCGGVGAATVRRLRRPHNWRYVQVPAAACDACARGREAAHAAASLIRHRGTDPRSLAGQHRTEAQCQAVGRIGRAAEQQLKGLRRQPLIARALNRNADYAAARAADTRCAGLNHPHVLRASEAGAPSAHNLPAFCLLPALDGTVRRGAP